MMTKLTSSQLLNVTLFIMGATISIGNSRIFNASELKTKLKCFKNST